MHIDKTLGRFLLLIGAASVGLIVHPYITFILYDIISDSNLIDPNNPQSNLVYVNGIGFGLPIFLVLWWFRTRDTRQSIQHNNLFSGLRLLASDNALEIDIGVYQLIELSKAVPEHRDVIRIAFIRRLKTRLPQLGEMNKIDKLGDQGELEKVGNSIDALILATPPRQDASNNVRLVYAQHIIDWLIRNKTKETPNDFSSIDLTNQNFEIQHVVVRMLQEPTGCNICKIANLRVPSCEHGSMLIMGVDKPNTPFGRVINHGNKHNDLPRKIQCKECSCDSASTCNYSIGINTKN